MAIKRAPSTGLPAVNTGKDGLIDEASDKKTENNQTTKGLMLKLTGLEKDKLKHEQIAYDFEDMEGKNSWIAVIHADGNGLGNIVQKVCTNSTDAKRFSSLLDEITKAAAQKAYWDVENDFKSKIIPIRPVVLGGDDLTLICRADLAVNFTHGFLREFEKQSKEQLKELSKKYEVVKQGLTACAGIAFVKSSYPFHYAVGLAESLCKRAKGKAREINRDLAPSCMMFHKLQDSFVEDYSEMAKRELTPQINLSFEAGPYYLQGTNTIDDLLQNIKKLEGKEGNAIKSHLRQWLSLLFENVGAADQKMKRVRTVNDKARGYILEEFEKLDKSTEKKIPYHDILSLASILFGETKNEED
jgi:hypothetical protein